MGACANTIPDHHLRTLLLPSAFHAVRTPAVYSMVKYGGVKNYIVATFNETDLEACADLNLPCADITSFLPEALNYSEPDSGKFGTELYFVSFPPCHPIFPVSWLQC